MAIAQDTPSTAFSAYALRLRVVRHRRFHFDNPTGLFNRLQQSSTYEGILICRPA